LLATRRLQPLKVRSPPTPRVTRPKELSIDIKIAPEDDPLAVEVPGGLLMDHTVRR
jgi:hypothetical protein